MAIRAITALFDDYEAAARAVDKLEAEGIPNGDISIVANNADDRHGDRVSPAGEAVVSARNSSENEASDGAGTCATLDTLLGGGAGLLAGLGLLAIPGIGPVVAAGWLVATVTGAGIGAATGGLLGALTGAGLTDHDAETYAEGVRRGGTLVTARVDDGHADRIMAILDRHGSIDLDERAQDWRAQGWAGTAKPGAVTDPSGETGMTAIETSASMTTGLATGIGPTKLHPDESRPSGTSPGPSQTFGSDRR